MSKLLVFLSFVVWSIAEVARYVRVRFVSVCGLALLLTSQDCGSSLCRCITHP